MSDSVAMFEATRHGAQVRGKDYVNPGSEILSAEICCGHGLEGSR